MTEVPTPVNLLGVKIHPVTQTQLIELLVDWALHGSGKRAYYVNAHAMNLAWDQPLFRDSLNNADLVYCDGYGVKWGAAVRGIRLPDRLAIPDWTDQFLERIVSTVPIFLLGDHEGVAEACANAIRAHHPSARIAGTHTGFFDVNGSENQSVIREVRESGAGILLVGMGMPRQENWIEANLEELQVALTLSVGALFRYYAQIEKRAPRWMTNRGLEWLGRLGSHPVRLARRYLIGNPLLIYRVLAHGRNSKATP